jgi:hypothetical protein
MAPILIQSIFLIPATLFIVHGMKAIFSKPYFDYLNKRYIGGEKDYYRYIYGLNAIGLGLVIIVIFSIRVIRTF